MKATTTKKNPCKRGMRVGGAYTLLCPIGAGGMAQVWAAEQMGDFGFKRLVALKTILSLRMHDAETRSLFIEEAKLTANIRHANVVSPFDLFVEDELLFQSMPLIDGTSLSKWLQHLPQGEHLPTNVGIRIMIDVLHGLHAAHELRDPVNGELLELVHRDVSPQNVLIGLDGVARLSDFGIAASMRRRRRHQASSPPHCESGARRRLKGKFGYLAPELHEQPASRLSDIFSAGVVLWQVLTSTRNVDASTKDTTVLEADRRLDDDDNDNRPAHAPVDEALTKIAMRALAKDPRERFQTALEMADALEQFVEDTNLRGATHREVARSLDANLGSAIAMKNARISNKRGDHDESDESDDEDCKTTPFKGLLSNVG